MNLSNHLLSPIILLYFLLASVFGYPAQKFIYNANDVIVVQEDSTVQLSLQLTTTADEYLSESDL